MSQQSTSNGLKIGNSFFYLGVELSLSKNANADIFKFIVLENEFWSYVCFSAYIYKISSLGRVQRVSRITESKSRNIKSIKLKSKFLSRQISRDGYVITSLSIDSKTSTQYIHRLVCLNYINNPDTINFKEVNHKNGNKKDNRMCNLEWSDRSNNIKHGYDTGLFPKKIGSSNHSSRLTEKEVIQIKKDKKQNPSLTLKYFADKYNVDQSTISLIHREKNWKHIKI